jgi:hypothetical protein
MIFKKSKTYDVFKTIALIMPLFIVLYEAIGKIWGIPYTEQITMTLTAINAFIGGLVKYSNAKYNKTELIEEYDQEEENAMELETDEEGGE